MHDKLCYSAWLYSGKPFKKKTIHEIKKGSGYYEVKTLRKGKKKKLSVKKMHPQQAIARIAKKQNLNKYEATIIYRVSELRQHPTKYELKVYNKLKDILNKQYDINPIFQHCIRVKQSFFVCDIYLPKVKICVEVDGLHHAVSPSQKTHDLLRDSQLMEIGITTIRLGNKEVSEDFKSALNRVLRLVHMRLHGVSSHKTTPTLNP